MARSLYELREEVDRLSAVYERLLRLWQQDLASAIGELGAGLEEVREQIELIETKQRLDDQG